MSLLLCSLALAETLERSPAPEWVESFADLEEVGPPLDEARHGLQFLVVDDQLRMREPGEEEAWFLHRSYRVVTHEGLDDGARFEVDVDPSHQRVLFHDISVYRAGAWEDRLELAQATDLRREDELVVGLMDGMITKTVLLPDVQVGDIVRYSYTILGNDPVFGEGWSAAVDMAWGLPTERRVLRVVGEDVPEPRAHGLVPTHSRDSTGLRWDYGPVPAVYLEGGAPAGGSEQPWVQLSTWSSWKELAAWELRYYGLSETSPELDALAEELSREEDPLTAAVTWVQDEIRYFGMELAEGSHVPRSPETVLRLRYGDCKDKTLLLSALLRRLGYASWPALVNSSGAPLDQMLPMPGVFDHVILLVDADGGTWVDPTYRLQGGAVGERHTPDYGLALPLREGQQGLVDMYPQGPPSLRRVTTWSYELPAAGVASVEVVEQTQREDADELRAWFNDATPQEIGEGLAQLYGGQAFLVPMELPRLLDEREASRAQLSGRYRIEDPWQPLLDGSESFTLLEPTVFGALPYPEPGRAAALALPQGLELVDHVEVKASNDTVYSEGQGQLVSRWFRFDLSSSQQGGDLSETYQLRVLKDRVESHELNAYREQMDQLYMYSGVSAQRHVPAVSDGFLGGLVLGIALGVGLSLGLAALVAAVWLAAGLRRKPA